MAARAVVGSKGRAAPTIDGLQIPTNRPLSPERAPTGRHDRGPGTATAAARIRQDDAAAGGVPEGGAGVCAR
jgi:hypothetical protein